MPKLLQIHLLGALEIVCDGEPVSLPASRKSRALLAYLVATRLAHSRERLCDLLWEGTDDPRAALRWSLTKLRPLLDDDTTTRLAPAKDRVEFEPRGAVVDVSRLRELVRPGVAALSMETLQEAAGLFHGEFLEGLDLVSCYRFQQWCAGERESLRQLHSEILGRLVARLPAGEEALAYARRRVAIDPFADDPHAAMIRILGALGRNQLALRHYEDCRILFERELGSRPSESIEDARRAIGKAGPISRVEVAPQLRSPELAASLIGRREVVAEIDRIIEATLLSGSEKLVLISGEPGIGKSRLLEEARRCMQQRGGVTLQARAFAAENARPYGVWIDALRPFAATSTAEGLRADLSLLFPDGQTAASDARDRTRLFDAVVALLSRVTERGGMIVLDDIQWLDEASAALLHYVCRATRGQRLLVLCAARVGELEDNGPVWRVVRELGGEQRLLQSSWIR